MRAWKAIPLLFVVGMAGLNRGFAKSDVEEVEDDATLRLKMAVIDEIPLPFKRNIIDGY